MVPTIFEIVRNLDVKVYWEASLIMVFSDMFYEIAIEVVSFSVKMEIIVPTS